MLKHQVNLMVIIAIVVLQNFISYNSLVAAENSLFYESFGTDAQPYLFPRQVNDEFSRFSSDPNHKMKRYMLTQYVTEHLSDEMFEKGLSVGTLNEVLRDLKQKKSDPKVERQIKDVTYLIARREATKDKNALVDGQANGMQVEPNHGQFGAAALGFWGHWPPRGQTLHSPISDESPLH